MRISGEKQNAKIVLDNDCFRHLFDAIGDPVFVIGPENNYIEVNKAACNTLGFSREELLRLSPQDLVPPESVQQVAERIKLIKQHGKLTFESDKICKNGTALSMEINAALLHTGDIEVIVGVARDITARKKAEKQLANQKKYFEAIFRSSSDAIVSLDHNLLVVDINPRFKELFGYSLDELKGRDINDFIYESPGEYRKYISMVLEGRSFSLKTLCKRKDGSIINVLARGSPIIMENRITGVLCIYTGIAEQANTNKKLLEDHKLQQDIIDFLPDPTFVLNREGEVIAWNRAMEKMSGIKKEEIVGARNREYAIPFYGCKRPALIDYLITGDERILTCYQNIQQAENKIFAESYAPELYMGRGAYLWITVSPLYDKDGKFTGAIESIRDISERKEREDKLEFLSWHDQLTGLYNRTYFEHKIKHLNLAENLPVTVFSCDVDGLKLINDTMGHNTGDSILKSAAAVIRDSIRSTDMAARIGGDEFAILLTGTDSATGTRIRRRIEQAIAKHNLENIVPLSISMGMATTSDPSASIADLFKRADDMMYREKITRSGRYSDILTSALLAALDSRDYNAQGHCERLASLSIKLGKAINLPEHRLESLYLLARFHDIGKVGIPDKILFKTGPLADEELAQLQAHCEIGHRIARALPDLAPIADLILKHHEWWNGKGYPLGLKELEIPLECRILSIVDAYDAMTSGRPYRKAVSPGKALDELRKYAGVQFDPLLVEEFCRLINGTRSS